MLQTHQKSDQIQQTFINGIDMYVNQKSETFQIAQQTFINGIDLIARSFISWDLVRQWPLISFLWTSAECWVFRIDVPLVYHTYDNKEHQRRASVYRYSFSNSVVKCVQLYVISKMMNFKMCFLSYYSRVCEWRLLHSWVQCRINVFSYSLFRYRNFVICYSLSMRKNTIFEETWSFWNFGWKRNSRSRHSSSTINSQQDSKTLSRPTLQTRPSNFNSPHARRTFRATLEDATIWHESWQTCLWLQKHEQWKYIRRTFKGKLVTVVFCHWTFELGRLNAVEMDNKK